MTLSNRLVGQSARTAGIALLALISSQLAASAQVAEPADVKQSLLQKPGSELATDINEPAQLADEPEPGALDLEVMRADVADQAAEQPVSELPAEPVEPNLTPTAEQLSPAELEPPSAVTAPADPTADEAVELAQVPGAGIITNNSYIGIGGNIGVGEDGAPGGDPGFAFISKIGFTDRFAVRPAVIIGDDVSILVPVTFDIAQALPSVGEFDLQPYVGGGVAFSVGDDSEVAGLLSAGLDVPISSRFTANGQANLGIGDDLGFGVTLGVGYNFGNLLR